MYKRWAPQKNRFTAKKALKWLKKAKTWQLLVLLILCGFIAATLLRLNNIGMIQHRDAVLQADKKLNSSEAKKQLVELQHYVTSHMNSELVGGVFLENIYLRDYDKAIEEASNAHNTNSDVYQKAAIDCRAQYQGGAASFRNDYVTCVQNKVNELPEDQQDAANVPHPEEYRYNFASPLISLDFAGIAVIMIFLLSLFILLRLAALYTLRFIIKRRAKIL